MSDNKNRNFSFEFFPPRNVEGEARLDSVHQELSRLQPDFFSVTYGAGGSTKQGTRQIVLKCKQCGSNVAPHLSFGGSNDDEVRQLLQDYIDSGIDRIVALRGDIPSGTGSVAHYRFADELVQFIRAETGDYFHIDVACYPEIHPHSSDYDSDISFFKRKVDAGADSAITQYFYNADAYFHFVESCHAVGIEIPIVPGIMPITNFASLSRFSANCGAEIPRWIVQRLRQYGDDKASIRKFGIEVVTRLCENLLAGGAPGLHFYTMNQSAAVTEIWNNLALTEKSA